MAIISSKGERVRESSRAYLQVMLKMGLVVKQKATEKKEECGSLKNHAQL